MKVTYLTNMRMPTEKAHGQQMMRMSDAFQEVGVEVDFVCPRRKNTPELSAQKNQLEQFYCLRHPVQKKELWAMDLFFARPHFLGQKMALWAQLLSFVLSLRLRLRAWPRRIFYLRDLWTYSFMHFFFSRRFLRKVVLEIHSLSNKRWKRRWQIKLLREAPAVVAVTQGLKDQMVEQGLAAEKILVAHDGVDLSLFKEELSQCAAREFLQLDPDWLLLSFIGKFHTNGEEKGIPQIIASASSILSQFPQAHFLFVGGPMNWAQRYQRKIYDWGLPADRFHFYDRCPSAQVPVYLAASDILLMPHPWTEFYAHHVSPLKMFEYMAAKKPIVASKLPAIMEVLVHGKNALLAEPGDPHDIAKQIQTFLTDQSLAQRISEQARRDVVSYTWEKRAQKIVDFVGARVLH